MGLYDSIHIEYPNMPMPENASSKEEAFIRQGIYTNTFQTKDLYACLDNYLIDEYGRFFSLNVSDFDQTIDKQEYIHQHIECYTHIDVDEDRYWLNYDIKFTDGILSEVKVLEWKKTNGIHRNLSENI